MLDESTKPIIKHIPDFLDYCEIEKGLAENTQRNYQMYLRVFVLWLKTQKATDKLPHQLSADDVWDYRLYLARTYLSRNGARLSKKTQNYYLIALRALLDYFTDRDIASLPSSKIKLPKHEKTASVKFLTLEQVKKLLETPKIATLTGLRDRAILETLFSTGLRISEMTALNHEHMHFKDPQGLELTVKGKGQVLRTVYFSLRALFWIKKYLDKRGHDFEKALFANTKSKNNENRRLTPRSIQTSVSRYAKLAGIPLAVTPHTLRHSYATDLLIQGVDLRTVQEFLGHKNVATTQIYTHVTNSRLRDVHKKFHGGNKLDE